MTRYINLLQADMLPGHGRLQLPAFVMVLLIALLGCGAWVTFAWHQQQSLKAELSYWQQQQSLSEQALRQTRSINPQFDTEAALRLKNSELAREKIRLESSYSGLSTQLDNSSLGFSAPLAQLSNHDLDGLWLDRIELRNGQQHLGLSGFTRQPGLVPQYLSQLQGSVFSGITIHNLNIEQTQRDAGLWRFTLTDAAIDQAALADRKTTP